MHRSNNRPEIVLDWLVRLRWLAVVGQVGATTVSILLLDLDLPLGVISALAAITLASNIALLLQRRVGRTPEWLLSTVVLFDVLMLSTVLFFTGGTRNPFSILFIVHIAIGVVVLSPVWTWVIFAVSVSAYAMLSFIHRPLFPDGRVLPYWASEVGGWLAVVLTSGLTVYFIGRLQSSLRQREQELLSTRERVMRSERLASVTALAAGAAHELGSPLGTIAVVAKELEINASRGAPAAEIAEDAQLIREEVERCRAILNRMRLEVGDDLRFQPSDISAQEFIDGACVDLTDDRKAHVLADVSPGCEQVFLPSRAILRAVGVLLRNGFEASPPGASITLRISRNEQFAEATVIDTGHGMPPEVLKRAGEPFFTTKEMGRGMGMGLFIVKLIAEQNGGGVRMESEAGNGTTATIYWPEN